MTVMIVQGQIDKTKRFNIFKKLSLTTPYLIEKKCR